MYSFESRVRYSELDLHARLRLDAMVNYMQDCACFESEHLGLGMGTVYGRRKMWVLNFWQVVIDRYPGLGEQLTVSTQACGSEKMFGYRNFTLRTGKGMAARAYSIWTLLDLERKRPCRVAPEDIAPYGTAEPLPLEPVSRKLQIPGTSGEAQKTFAVQEYHLDTNGHVNNGQYVRMAQAYLPEGFAVRELRAEYRRQARPGDWIAPVCYLQQENALVSLQSPEGDVYAVVLFFAEK